MTGTLEPLGLRPPPCSAGSLGLERVLARKTAGLRTHMLVAVAASVLMLVGDAMAERVVASQDELRVTSDPLRVMEAIVVGISFLDAGTIVQSGLRIKGSPRRRPSLVTAAVGLAVAAGQVAFAACVALGVVAALLALGRLERRGCAARLAARAGRNSRALRPGTSGKGQGRQTAGPQPTAKRAVIRGPPLDGASAASERGGGLDQRWHGACFFLGVREVTMAWQSTKRGRPTPRGGRGDVGGNQGEGNREADRRYREEAKRFAESGRVEPAARDAAEALEEEEPVRPVADADRPADDPDDDGSDEPR